MNALFRTVIFALSFLPLAAKFPYMLRAWKSTPLEGGDPLMWLAVPFVALLCEFVRRKVTLEKNEEKFPILNFAAIVAMAGAWFAVESRVNAAGILAAIAIIAAAVNFRFGRNVLLSQVPSFFFAVLACPSVSFWLDYYLQTGLDGATSYFIAKFALSASFLALWCGTVIVKRRYPRIINILFYVCVCAALLINRVESQSVPVGAPLFINETPMQKDAWIAKEMPVSKDDLRFFRGCSKITRRTYFNDISSLNYLGLEIDDISNIHPIGICMKSAGFDLRASRQIYLDVDGAKVQVNEIAAEMYGGKLTVYSWFSNSEFSTGDFRKFRLSHFSKSKWRHYQIIVPGDESVSKSRRTMEDFMRTFGER